MLSLIQSHSKTKNLTVSHQMQEYLKSDLLSCKQQILLFSLRVRTADIKTNYRNKFRDNMKCRYECGSQCDEDLNHLLNCSSLLFSDQLKEEASKVNASDIYGTIEQQKKIICVYEKIYRRIENMKTRGLII